MLNNTGNNLLQSQAAHIVEERVKQKSRKGYHIYISIYIYRNNNNRYNNNWYNNNSYYYTII